MKKRILSLIICVAIAFSMTACGTKPAETEVVEETVEVEEPVTLVNPMTEVTVEELFEQTGIELPAPAWGEDVHWFVYDIDGEKLAEMQFVYEGKNVSLRAKFTEIPGVLDISGMYFTKATSKDTVFSGYEAKLVLEDGMGYLSWYDDKHGIVYCLSTSDNADEKFLVRVANIVYVPSTLGGPAQINLYKTFWKQESFDDAGETLLAESSYYTLNVDSDYYEEYEKLNEALDSFSYGVENEALEYLDMNTEWAKEDGYNLMGTYAYDSNVYATRADETVVSLIRTTYTYTGGVHGMYFLAGNTYDTKKGTLVELTDVIKDTSSLSEILSTELKEKFGERIDMEGLEDTIDGYVEDLSSLSWTLGYNGITFYFAPYQIASYAAGWFNITIYAEEYPDLLNTKYFSAPAVYAVPVIGDRVIGYEADEGLISEVLTEIQNQYETYLVHTPNMDYLWLSVEDGIGYGNLLIYTIDTEAIDLVYSQDGLFIQNDNYQNMMTNLSDIRMSKLIDIIIPSVSYGFYSLDDDFKPVQKDADDELYLYFDYVITNKVDFLACPLADNDSDVLDPVVIPKGTELGFWKTDGYSYMDIYEINNPEIEYRIEMITDSLDEAKIYQYDQDAISTKALFEEADTYLDKLTRGRWGLYSFTADGEEVYHWDSKYESRVRMGDGKASVLIKDEDGGLVLSENDMEIVYCDYPLNDFCENNWCYELVSKDEKNILKLTVTPKGMLQFVYAVEGEDDDYIFSGKYTRMEE